MSPDSAFHKRSVLREGSMRSAIAREAQKIVKDAARPIPPGENIKGQLRRACANLGYPQGHWRVLAAWKGEAAAWSAEALDELRARSEAWGRRKASLADAEAEKLAALYMSISRRLESNDVRFHRNDIAALVDQARILVDFHIRHMSGE